MCHNDKKHLTNEMLESAFKQFKDARNLPHSRFLSWEHCIVQFADVFKTGKSDNATVDYLSLHLGFFLASWGMLRNSDLMDYDYKIHIPLINKIMKHSGLYGKDLSDFCKDSSTLKEFKELYKEVVDHCEQFSTAKSGKPSNILVGKIIMGTLGIAPAYDKFVTKAVKTYGVSQVKFNAKAFEEFAEYFTENHSEITKKLTKEAKKLCPHYTRAKVIDSLLWFIGQDE